MSWQAEVDDIERRRLLALELGGPEKVARQRRNGKLTVRERIARMADEGSFREEGALSGTPSYDGQGNLVGFMAANFLYGRAEVDGRTVLIQGDDFTIRGGAADGGIKDKMYYAERFAWQWRLPMIRLLDGTGGGGSVKLVEQIGHTYVPEVRGWDHFLQNLATVPVASVLLGSVAGFGAARAVMSHYSVMVKETSHMFVAGPPVVAGMGKTVTKEELGGSTIHTRNGAIDDEVESEEEAFARVRRFLSYLPGSIHELPKRGPVTDDPGRKEEFLLAAVPRNPRRVYRMHQILEACLDRDSLFEIGAKNGPSVITALGRVDGWPVAVLAGNPYVLGGAITAEAAQKIQRFVDLAQQFHLPVIHFVDCPGMAVGPESERATMIRLGARAISAVFQASVPWCSILVRKVYGVGGGGHQNGSRANIRYAWPSAEWGSLPLAGGIEAAYKSDIERAEDPEAFIQDVRERVAKIASPFRTAEAFRVENIIDPRETRPKLVEFVTLAQSLLTPGPAAWGPRP